jgi:hypothetical protein
MKSLGRVAGLLAATVLTVADATCTGVAPGWVAAGFQPGSSCPGDGRSAAGQSVPQPRAAHPGTAG